MARADGNVTVRVDRGGNLIVEGDDADNEILISPVALGEGSVIGLGSTLVNDGEIASFSGAARDFRIRMNGGNDSVSVADGDDNRVPKDLQINTGTGSDHVLIQGFFVQDDLHVRTGPGDDTVELADTVSVLGRTEIQTGSGNDQVLLVPADVPYQPIVFEDDFVLRSGAGTDFVNIEGALFRDVVDVHLGDGDDIGRPGGAPGGVCVCATAFEDENVLEHVQFNGGEGEDGAVLEAVCGIAPPGLLQDFLREFESFPDDCSFLGGEACSRGCE